MTVASATGDKDLCAQTVSWYLTDVTWASNKGFRADEQDALHAVRGTAVPRMALGLSRQRKAGK
jgi:hypothetical protein